MIRFDQMSPAELRRFAMQAAFRCDHGLAKEAILALERVDCSGAHMLAAELYGSFTAWIWPADAD